MTATQTAPVTKTLEREGATIAYDVRENAASTQAPLMIIGSPMSAAGFGTLLGHFPERTVVTYDPRGSDRSVKADPTSPSTPDQHADDLHAVIAAVGRGPVDLFASSGGAVNALALVARHPEDVGTLVAHEPPLASALPDSVAAMKATEAVNRTYLARGSNYGMAHFIASVSQTGEFSPDWADQPGPDPQMFGMPTTDDGTRTDVLLAQNMISCTHYMPDYDALRRASTRIILAAGSEQGTMANRAAHAVAERLGSEAVAFPGGHAGFLGGEFGQQGEPDAFAAKLHEVID
jgi:pimeloyl-ACP methyl ester carboxylesterase